MNFHTSLATGLALALAATAPSTAQTTVTLTADRDNTLYESATGTISNAQGPLFIGRNGLGQDLRSLVRFDVAGNVPAGAVVISAELEYSSLMTVAGLASTTFVHRALADWGEGTSGVGYGGGPGGGGGGGAPATNGDATWLHRSFPTQFWTTPGGDFHPAPSFTMTLPGIGTATSLPAPGLVLDVQDMLDNPAGNFGWLLKVDEAIFVPARKVISREGPTTFGVRPTLRVTYLQPSQTGKVGLGCPTPGGNFDVEFVGAAIGGQVVTIDRTNAVPASIGADFFSLYIDPIGVPLQPGCTVYLPLAQELLPGGAFLSGTGASSGLFGVPAGFPGFLISCQSIVLDSSPFGLSLSNAAVMILQ